MVVAMSRHRSAGQRGRTDHGRNAPRTLSGRGSRAARNAAALTSAGVCQRGPGAHPSVSRRVTPGPSGAQASRTAGSVPGAPQRLVSTCTSVPGTRAASVRIDAAGAHGAYASASPNEPRAAMASSSAPASATASVASTAAAYKPAPGSSIARRATTVTGTPVRASAVAAGPRIPVPPITRK